MRVSIEVDGTQFEVYETLAMFGREQQAQQLVAASETGQTRKGIEDSNQVLSDLCHAANVPPIMGAAEQCLYLLEAIGRVMDLTGGSQDTTAMDDRVRQVVSDLKRAQAGLVEAAATVQELRHQLAELTELNQYLDGEQIPLGFPLAVRVQILAHRVPANEQLDTLRNEVEELGKAVAHRDALLAACGTPGGASVGMPVSVSGGPGAAGQR